MPSKAQLKSENEALLAALANLYAEFAQQKAAMLAYQTMEYIGKQQTATGPPTRPAAPTSNEDAPQPPPYTQAPNTAYL